MVNAIYYRRGTPLVFGQGSYDALMTLRAIANGAGRVSTQLDLGADPRTILYLWEAQFKCQAAVVVGSGVQINFATAHSSASAIDDGLSATDAALSAVGQIQMSPYAGDVKSAGTASGAGPFKAGGKITLYSRYVSAVLWNASGQTTTDANNTDNWIKLIPVYPEIQ